MALGNGFIVVPPPKPLSLEGQQQPQALQQGSIAVPAAPKPFALPDGTAPQASQTENMTVPQKAGEVAQGVTKGLLGSLLGSSAAKAGPVGADMLAHAPAFAKNIQSADEVSTPTNGYQTAGSIAGGLIMPGGVAKGEVTAMAASKLARAGEDAVKIASPKMTLGTVERGITSLSDDPHRVQKVADAIKGMVESKALSLGDDAKTATKNAAALKDEIIRTAEGLKNSLKSMDVTPILERADLEKIFKGSMAEVEKNPYLEEGASKQAKKMFDLFYEQLPKGKDLAAHDILEARKTFDAAISKMKPTAFDPKSENATSVALKAIRRGINDLIAEKAPDVKVKVALARQTALYDALENVGKKGALAIKQAMELAAKPGIGGVMERHPLITKGLQATGAGLLGILGFEGGKKILGE